MYRQKSKVLLASSRLTSLCLGGRVRYHRGNRHTGLRVWNGGERERKREREREKEREKHGATVSRNGKARQDASIHHSEAFCIRVHYLQRWMERVYIFYFTSMCI